MPETLARPKIWSPFGIAWMTIVLSSLAGGVLYALNEQRLGRETWRATLYRNLLLGSLLLLPAMLRLELRTSALSSVNLFIALYFYKTQSELFTQHVAAGGAKARFWIPLLITLAAGGLYSVLVGF